MKKTNLLGMAFSFLCVSLLGGVSAFAQSTDPDNPTVVTQSVIQWKNPGNREGVFYYTFTAGPGTLEVTTDQRSGGITAMPKLSWQLLDAKFNQIKAEDMYQVTTAERKVTEITLTKKQKVILKVVSDKQLVNFKFQFDGAVSFASGNSGSEDIPEITGEAGQGTQQICMPRNGVLIMTMQDGKKAKVDLSKVQKIEIQ